MLIVTPFLYFDGSFAFVSISDQPNPARAIAALTPLGLAVAGTIINRWEMKRHRRGSGPDSTSSHVPL